MRSFNTKNIVISCSLLLYGINLRADDPPPCAPAAPAPAAAGLNQAVADSKAALITELLCVENFNKELILKLRRYEKLQRAIRGQDGSDCLAMRCITKGELYVEVIGTPADVWLQAKFGGGQSDNIKVGEATAVDFNGIIGTANTLLTDPCHDTTNSMSYLEISNTSGKAVTLSSIKMELRFTNDSYKVIFEDDSEIELLTNKSFTINKSSILDNQAFITAAVGSCHDG